jgi:hypothetical protein
MTLVCGIKQRNATYLYADTAYVEPGTGIVQGFSTKIFAGRQFPWALAITATLSIEGAKALSVLDPRNVVGLCRDLPNAVQAFGDVSTKAGLPDASIRILAGCWDARKAAPRLFCIHNMDPSTQAVGEPGELVEMDFMFGTDDDELAEVWRNGSPNHPACFDPEHDAVAVYDRLRARPYKFAGRHGYWIGGELERATITRRGVLLEALRSWSDTAGEPLCSVALSAGNA